MRTIHWLFVVSVALFVGGIAFVIAAERTARAAAPLDSARGRPPAPEMRAAAPIATVLQIMNGVVAPSAQVIWDSVSSSVTAAGIEEKQPRTDEEWAQVATGAALLVESANLLLEGERAVDTGDWPKMAQAMAASAAQALQAAQARSVDGLFTVGGEIYETCTACHERYSRN